MGLASDDPWRKRSFRTLLKRKRKAKRKLPASATGRLGARARRRTGKQYRSDPNW